MTTEQLKQLATARIRESFTKYKKATAELGACDRYCRPISTRNHLRAIQATENRKMDALEWLLAQIAVGN